MADKVNINVIEVEGKSFEELKAILSGLSYPAGYGPGLDVVAQKIDGLYLFKSHRGTIVDSVEPVRVVGSQIWTKGYADMIERQLQEQHIPYRRGDVEVEKGASKKEHLDPVNLEGRVKLTHTPCLN